MTKVLFILSAIAMAVSIYFSYSNGRELTAVREEKASKHRQIKNLIADVSKVSDDLQAKTGEIAKITQEVDIEAEKLKSYKLKLTQAENDLKRLAEGYKEKEEKMAKLKAELAGLPAGMKPETIGEEINKIKQQTIELQTQSEAKKKEIAAEQEKLDAAQKDLTEVVSRIESRKKSFDRNSLSGNLVAVNNDWGFVVLNVGERESITPETKLIVVRGTATVGKLNIVSVKGQRTIANILPDTLAPGMAPAPGDRVILENLFQ
jgi:small-conductance mechanosensitive channel